MPAPSFTTEQREAILEYAAERGDRAASLLFGVAEPTLRSWRHRTGKVTDVRAGAAVAVEDGEANGIGDDLAEVQVTTDEWDGGAGCYRKIPARARVLEKFNIGNQYVSRGELRELRAPGTAGLAVGELVLLGGRRYAEYGDALWAVVERQDGALLVRPAGLRRDEKLSDDGSRIIAKASRRSTYHPRSASGDGTSSRIRSLNGTKSSWRLFAVRMSDAHGIRCERSHGDRRGRATRS